MQYRIFKPTYTDRKTKGQRESETFYVEFRDHNGTRQRGPAYPDQKRTDAMAKKIAELVDCRITGEPVDEKMMRWVESTDESLRDRLNDAGIVEVGQLGRREPLVTHLKGRIDANGIVAAPGYEQHLMAGRPDRKEYAALMAGRVYRVFDALGLMFWRDLRTNDAQTRIETHLHTQALRAEMAIVLKDRFADKMPGAAAFAMPDKFLCAKMFRHDLSAAREAWIKEAATDLEETVKRGKSDFLSDLRHDAKRAIFYSLRHSHGTALGDAGIHQKDIAASLHHTRTATTDRYAKGDLQSKARAVESLPNVTPSKELLIATGTDNETGNGCLSPACQTAYSSVESSETKKALSTMERAVSNEGDGVRTRNHRIDSLVTF